MKVTLMYNNIILVQVTLLIEVTALNVETFADVRKIVFSAFFGPLWIFICTEVIGVPLDSENRFS